MKKSFVVLSLLAGLAAIPAFAQTLTDVKFDPPQPVVGQSVTAVVTLEMGDTAFCGVRLDWGDGSTSDIKVEDKSTPTYPVSHVYTQPGNYRTMAEGTKVTSHLGCLGKNVVRMLAVALPRPAVRPAAAGGTCPEGWALDKKSVNKKTGAYTCTTRPGTPLPLTNPTCPGDLSYFENVKKGQLGCRP